MRALVPVACVLAGVGFAGGALASPAHPDRPDHQDAQAKPGRGGRSDADKKNQRDPKDKSDKGARSDKGTRDAQAVAAAREEQARLARLSKYAGFGVGERELARAWFARTLGRGQCPPGLDKTPAGCLPPGQKDKPYRAGDGLPPGVRMEPLPAGLREALGPAPDRYVYAMVGADLVKLSGGSLVVVDAVSPPVE